MKIILIGFIVLFSLSVGYSQTVEHLSHDDSIHLTKFWMDLTYSISHKDLKKLDRLCHFPFTCNPCVEDADSGRDYITVDKNNFYKGRYRFFFHPGVLKTLTKYNMPKDLFIFRSAYDESGKKQIGYDFVCMTRLDTKTGPGYGIFMTVGQILGSYKIIAIWKIP